MRAVILVATIRHPMIERWVKTVPDFAVDDWVACGWLHTDAPEPEPAPSFEPDSDES